jgi:hypothetical protein
MFCAVSYSYAVERELCFLVFDAILIGTQVDRYGPSVVKVVKRLVPTRILVVVLDGYVSIFNDTAALNWWIDPALIFEKSRDLTAV